MPPNMRPLLRVARPQSAWSRNPHLQRAFASQGQGQSNPLPGGTPGEPSVQAMPIGPYYESILTQPQPIPETKPEEPPTSSPKSPRSSRKTSQKSSKTNPESSSSSSGTTASTAKSTTTTTSTTAASSSSAAAAAAAAAASQTVPPQPTADPASAQEKARIIFGSRLAGPAERADRLQAIRDRSVLVAGVLVPPRPEEPDNCCMSGCVNCVWDRYGEELEDWAAASARAEEALQAERARARKSPSVDVTEGARAVKDISMPSPSPSSDNAAVSMDDDGGGSESNWRPEDMMKKAKMKTDRPKIAKDLWDDDLYSNVPVGIREFMKHEKRLKAKHREEGTAGG
ncbi:oxidoreductase-like protein [Xylaria sp. FL1042]|nr:oxidoreductase-like protein [Xylaria sp. FL1042]